MSFIIKAVTSCPEELVLQSDIKNHLQKNWKEKSSAIEELIDRSSVYSRHLSLPLNYYQDLHDFGKRNIIWKAEALRLQTNNIQKILTETEIDIADIGLLASATSTGVTVPSLEAMIMNKFPFSPNTIRLPLFGLGCLAGVSGINRVHDYLSTYTTSAAILMVTELCSLTFQLGDVGVANMMSTSLFGDASGAILMVGKDHPLVKLSHFEMMASESIFYSDTERTISWDMMESGFQISVSNDLPSLVKENLVKSIDHFLHKNKLTRSDINYYIAHPGGAEFLNILGETLNYDKDKFGLSWESLKTRGNTSGAGVLHVLEQTIASADIAPESLGIMLAMGPAFSLEMSLIKKLNYYSE